MKSIIGFKINIPIEKITILLKIITIKFSSINFSHKFFIHIIALFFQTTKLILLIKNYFFQYSLIFSIFNKIVILLPP